ncbi:MAG TPA: hypothetical protein ENI51_07380 [Candidatus Atribacteria bacterium]|nr:hypothetical protein [Candidatus Atribacteria bacterium]
MLNRQILRSENFKWAIIGAILCIFLSVILTPLFIDAVVFSGKVSGLIDVPEVNAEELNIEIKRHIEMEAACTDKGNFFGEKWRESYRVYGILIENKSDRLIEDFTLRVRLPGQIISHEEGGATELEFVIRHYNAMAFNESGRINTEKLPLRLIYIPKLPMNKALFFIILIDLEEDPEVKAILTSEEFKQIVKIEEGTYNGDYQWTALGKRMLETFSEAIESN